MTTYVRLVCSTIKVTHNLLRSPPVPRGRVRGAATEQDERPRLWHIRGVRCGHVRGGAPDVSGDGGVLSHASRSASRLTAAPTLCLCLRPFHDRVCKPVTECAADEFEVTAPTPYEDRVCEKKAKCDVSASMTQGGNGGTLQH